MKNITLSMTTPQKLFYQWQLVYFIRVDLICDNLSRTFELFISDNLSRVFAPKKLVLCMKFNFISDNLSPFSCIFVKESLVSLYNKNYGLNNRNIVIVISCFFYTSVKENTLHGVLFYIYMKNIILSMITQQMFFYQCQLVSFIRVNFICYNFSRAFCNADEQNRKCTVLPK